MKKILCTLAMAMWGYAAAGWALDDIKRVGCSNPEQVPGDFVDKCILAGGDEVRCSGSTPMCCKTTSEGTHCYDDPNDMKRGMRGTKIPTVPGGGTLAPPKSKPPKPKAPGKAPGTVK